MYRNVFCLQLLGVALLGAGVYALTAPETNLDNLEVDNFLTAPAILLCIIGGVLFLLGFCGCFGALLELYIPLIVVSLDTQCLNVFIHYCSSVHCSAFGFGVA